MADIIVILVILAAIIFAVRRTKKTKGCDCSSCHLSDKCTSSHKENI